MGGITGTTHGVRADESTITKTGNQFSIKDDGVTSAKIADGEIVLADLSSSLTSAFSNALSGVTPTISINTASWKTTPTNLANTTDLDFGTYSEGSLETVGQIGYFTWDLGSLKHINTVGVKAVIGATSGNGNNIFTLEYSANGTDWTTGYTVTHSGGGAQTNVNQPTITILDEIRYIRVSADFSTTTSGSGEDTAIRIYEVTAEELR